MKTHDLFILNENYPLNADMYKKYKYKIDRCGSDNQCISWVKHDIEGELKNYALKVGVKFDDESNFLEVGNVKIGADINKTTIVVFSIIAILVIFAISRKNWILGGGAAALGVFFYLKPEILIPNKDNL